MTQISDRNQYMANVTKVSLNEKIVLTCLQVAVFIMVCADVTFDVVEGLPMKAMIFDLSLEGSILILVLISTNYIWRRFTHVSDSKNALHIDLEKTKDLASMWEKKSKQFIIEFQKHLLVKFEQWKLSKSEREIAILLLKGKTSKDIASERFTSERTIRNQCRSLYEKAGLSGKNELSAYFLNELILDFG